MSAVMDVDKSFTVSPLAWLKGEIDHSLAVVRESLAQAASNRGEGTAALGACEKNMRQVRGALQILGMDGATRYCESIEYALIVFETGKVKLTQEAVSVLDRAVFALTQFLDDIAKGEPNVPLKLFPVYRELTELQGIENVSEIDLFHPDLGVQPPPHPAPQTLEAQALSRHVQANRSLFQRGLLAWLQKPGNRPGLQNMRIATDALDQVAHDLPGLRSVWWIAGAFIDAITLQDPAEWTVNVKAICGRIDRRMRDIASGAEGDDEPLAREMLYAVAVCRPLSKRMREVKQVFRLDLQIPDYGLTDTLEYDMGKLRPVLDDMRMRLEMIEDAWVKYTSGERGALALFRDQAARLKTMAKDLGGYRMVKLLDVVMLIASKLPEPFPKTNELLVMEMASAFLLMEHILDNFTNPPTDLEQQVTVMVGWLLDAVKPKGDGAPPAPALRDDITQRHQLQQIRSQVAKESLVNLQQVEQVLDAVVRDPAHRENIKTAPSFLRQIRGALTMLGLPRATEVLAVCEELVEQCARCDAATLARHMEWIAEGLSSVGFYLEPLQRGQLPTEGLLDRFLGRYGARDAASVPPTVIAGAAAPQEGDAAVPAAPEAVGDIPLARPAPPAPEDHRTAQEVRDAADLLVVYIEEAKEVLAGVEESLARLRANARDAEALNDMRRGFHTLKGSGRMVGLNDLGEFAWEIEQTLNQWLREERPASPGLVELVERSRAAFAGWAHSLEQRMPLDVAASGDIVALAQRLRAGEEQPQPVFALDDEPAAIEAPLAREPAPEPEAPEVAGAPEPEAAAPVADAPEPEAGEVEAVEPGAPEPEPAAAGAPDTAVPLERPAPEPSTGTLPALAPDVVIGDVSVSPALLEIYLKEAATHLATLDREFAAWSAAPHAVVSHDFMRAAHTLASSSRTTGFLPVAELAGTLEQWLLGLTSTPTPDPASDLPLVADAIRLLERMLAAVELREPPVPAVFVLSRMLARIERGLALPPVRLEAPAPVPVPAAPEPPPAIPVTDAGSAIRDDIDAELLPIFLEEATHLLPQVASELRAWRANNGDANAARALVRGLHTLKGSARMAGAMRVGSMTHALESRLEQAMRGSADPGLFEESEAELDRISDAVDELQRHGSAAPARSPSAPPEAPVADAAAPPRPLPLPAMAPLAPPATAALPAAMPGSIAATTAAGTLRVDADIVDRLVNEAGEISISRARVEGEMTTFKQSLLDLTDSVTRLRNQLRETQIQADSQLQSRITETESAGREFDPLEFDRYTRLQELTRMMAESLHDVSMVQQTLLGNLGESEAALSQQARVSRDLQQELLRMRSVPLSIVNERLFRTVRQTARQLRRKATLEVRGADRELDRNVLRRIAGPLEHMLRNAVAHGLESAEARLAAGKPESGQVVIELDERGNEHVLTLRDDGAGLNLELIRMEAMRKGLLAPGEEIGATELQQFIFAPGFSTAPELTQTSGRGIGLDVVRAEVSAIGGRVEVDSVPGQGTTFSIYLPLSLGQAQAVMIQAGEQTYAILSPMVEQIHEFKTEELSRFYETGAVQWQDTAYPFFYLPRLLGTPDAIAEIKRYNFVLFLRSGTNRVAVHVDRLGKNQEIVLKNIGPQLARVPGLTGATVLGNGQVVLIINPVQLALRATLTAMQASTRTRLATDISAAPVVMVVDDSLTVRRLTGRMLGREGYQVVTAKDGVDALQQIGEAVPDLMLLDIEMPRMDGFELLKQLRSDARTRDLPVIIITSRTADKHRNHALELGANAFFGKPYQDDELLLRCAELLGRVHPGANRASTPAAAD